MGRNRTALATRCGAAALVALLALGTAARAGGSLQDRAIAAYDDFEYKKALRLLEKAVQSRKLPPTECARLHLYLGLVRFTLGDKDLAGVEFEQALSHDPAVRPPPDTSPKIVKFFNQIRKRGAAAPKGAAAGADGKAEGTDEVAEVEAELMQELPADTADGKKTAADAADEPAGAGARSDAEKTADAGTAGAAVAGPAADTGEAPAGPSIFSGKLWTWVAAGAGGALLITGSAVGIAAHQDKQAFEDEKWGDRAARLEDDVQTKSLAANVLFGFGGAALAAAVVLFFVEGRSPHGDDADDQRLSGLSVGPGGVSASFRF